MLLLSRFSRVRLVQSHRWQPTRLLCPWDSPGKNTGIGCHFLLQCMKVKNESEVAQSCPTLSDPMDCSLPGFSVHGIFQARVLEWVAIPFSSEGVRTLLLASCVDLSCTSVHNNSKMVIMAWNDIYYDKQEHHQAYVNLFEYIGSMTCLCTDSNFY